MLGKGRLMVTMPFTPAPTGLPSSSTISTSQPGSGIPADPGLIGSMAIP
jgi:hypothetical protein